MTDDFADEISEDSKIENFYDPETLLSQIIDKIFSSSSIPDETTELPQLDELKAGEIAAGKERLLVGLITLTKKIIQTANTDISDKVI